MKTKIVIVTDVSLFSYIFIPLFKKECFEVQVDVFSSMDEIDEGFELNLYNYVLVDGGITQLSCFEAIQHIRIARQFKGPIWFFPEILTEDYILKSKMMGASLIIPKPFDPLQVVADYFKLESVFSKY